MLASTGCSKKDAEKEKISGKFIEKLVTRAISGSASANDSLGGLVNLKFPVNTDYNKLLTDSIRSKGGNLYYTVLLEFPNPAYNRFAVYDSLLRTYLIDKSLNGNITEDKLSTDGLSFLKINENFISKDIFNIQRLSLYSVGDSSVSKIFRTFTKMDYSKREYSQTVDEISAQRIKTSMTSNHYSPVRNKSDIFMFDSISRKYESRADLFDKYVTDVIDKSQNKVDKPELTDEKSVWESVGLNPQAENTQSTTTGSISEEGFSLTLSDDWKELKNFNVSEYLDSEFKGTRYLNNSIGTTISVFAIPVTNSAEDFIKYKLDKTNSNGRISIRNTDEIIDGKIFIQFYEFYCGNRKMMVIIKGSKYTYDDYKELYSRIINSFSMDC